MNPKTEERRLYVILWTYRVKPGSESQFERAYGPDGDWVRFFTQGEEYLGTQLLRDAEERGRYLTIDSWTSRAAYDAFRNKWRSEYQAIDDRCEPLTEKEERLGWFLSLSAFRIPDDRDRSK
jgi:heme-degrading monooxygenase HmoA